MERRGLILCVLAFWSVVVLTVCSIAEKRNGARRCPNGGGGAGGRSSAASPSNGSESSREVAMNDDDAAAAYNLHGYSYVVLVVPINKYSRGSDFYNVAGACTGTMIAPLFALAAAHCTATTSTDDIKVIHGHNGFSVSRDVVQICQHPGYNNTHDVPDLSVLKISSPFHDVSHYISLGGHPSQFANNKMLNCEVFTFSLKVHGIYMSAKGYATNVSVGHGPNACIKRNNKYRTDHINWQHFLCGEPDSSLGCIGGSSVPLICHGKQYGVTIDMYNLLGSNDTRCDDPNMRSRHVFLYMYTEWISEITGLHYDNLATSTIIRRLYVDVIAFVFCTTLHFTLTA